MTYDEIGKALGLLPSELYRCVGVARNVEKMRGCSDLWEPSAKHAALTRQTGRTTEMLIAALKRVSEGAVVRISAYDVAWECKLVRQLKSWAAKLKLDTNLIRAHQRGQGTYGGEVFADHYLGPAGMGRWPSEVANG